MHTLVKTVAIIAIAAGPLCAAAQTAGLLNPPAGYAGVVPQPYWERSQGAANTERKAGGSRLVGTHTRNRALSSPNQDSVTYKYSGSRNLDHGPCGCDQAYDTALHYTYDADTLRPADKYIKTYDANGKLTELRMLFWDTYVKAWRTANGKQSYIYNSQGQLVRANNYEWVVDTNTWRVNGGNTYTYNAAGKVATVAIGGPQPVTGLWQEGCLYTYVYDGEDKLVNEIFQQRDAATGLWVNNYRNERSYDADRNVIAYTSFDWVDGSWVPSFRTVYSDFAAPGQPNIATHQQWNGVSFDGDKQTGYKYNSYGQVLRSYDIVPGGYGYETRYTYEMYATAVAGIPADADIVAYPVPAQNELIIEMPLAQLPGSSVALTDMAGRVVVSEVIGSARHKINTAAMPAGNYILSVSNGKNTTNKMVVIAR